MAYRTGLQADAETGGMGWMAVHAHIILQMGIDLGTIDRCDVTR
jgi:hypothetical protein